MYLTASFHSFWLTSKHLTEEALCKSLLIEEVTKIAYRKYSVTITSFWFLITNEFLLHTLAS